MTMSILNVWINPAEGPKVFKIKSPKFGRYQHLETVCEQIK